MFHSGGTAVYKGAAVPEASGDYVPERRQMMVSRLESPYHFVLAAGWLPAAPFVLLYTEVPEIPSDRQVGAMVGRFIARASQCRE